MGILKFSFISLILLYATQAVAQNYAPGSVIILKEEKKGLRTSDQVINPNNKNKNQVSPSPETRLNKNIIVPPNNSIQGNPAAGREDKTSAAYAKHLYSSICAQNYRDSLAPRSEKNLDKQKMWTDVQASCNCMANEILSVTPAADLADFVMYNYGWQNNTQADAEYTAFSKSNKTALINNLSQNPPLRKKCGFVN